MVGRKFLQSYVCRVSHCMEAIGEMCIRDSYICYQKSSGQLTIVCQSIVYITHFLRPLLDLPHNPLTIYKLQYPMRLWQFYYNCIIIQNTHHSYVVLLYFIMLSSKHCLVDNKYLNKLWFTLFTPSKYLTEK